MANHHFRPGHGQGRTADQGLDEEPGPDPLRGLVDHEPGGRRVLRLEDVEVGEEGRPLAPNEFAVADAADDRPPAERAAFHLLDLPLLIPGDDPSTRGEEIEDRRIGCPPLPCGR